MKKLIKVCIIGGIVCAVADVCYFAGEGRMLGLMKKYDVSASETIQVFSNDKKWRLKFISWVANQTVES